MAYIKCEQCGSTIDTSISYTCPNCGVSNEPQGVDLKTKNSTLSKNKTTTKIPWWVILVTIAALIVCGGFYYHLTTKTIIGNWADNPNANNPVSVVEFRSDFTYTLTINTMGTFYGNWAPDMSVQDQYIITNLDNTDVITGQYNPKTDTLQIGGITYYRY
jgi:hypothetical protein